MNTTQKVIKAFAICLAVLIIASIINGAFHLINSFLITDNDVTINETYLNDIRNIKIDVGTTDMIIKKGDTLSIAAENVSKKFAIKEEENTLEEVEDSEEKLKRRLLEYQKYKESTGVFRNLEEKRFNYYTKAPESLKQYTTETLENDGSVDVYDLLNAFQNLLERQEYNKPLNTKITRKELSVKERVVKIREILKEQKKVKFTSLFDDFSKSYVVVTFLSVLEMAKNREITLKQDNNFSDIYLERVD